MKSILAGVVVLGVATSLNAQLWDGTPLPPSSSEIPSIDGYFSDTGSGGGLSEFDTDAGKEFSIRQDGTVSMNIDAAHGWTNAASFSIPIEAGDTIIATYLGNTAAWANDFGINLGGSGTTGPGAHTLWSGIGDTIASGMQYRITIPDDASAMPFDFWLNSNAATHGGTYSVFNPSESDPSNSGLPDFNYSARAKEFQIFDDIAEVERHVVVLALEDWRGFDADFSDLLIGIEVVDRNGVPQFSGGVPEPATFGLLGTMGLLALVAARGIRRSAA